MFKVETNKHHHFFVLTLLYIGYDLCINYNKKTGV